MANPHVNKANKYARDIVSGKIDACKWVKLSCQRHLDDLGRAKKKDFLYKFDPKKGEKICDFASKMVHTKGKWAKRREKIKLEPWQCFIFVVLFGWVSKKTGLRRFREAYCEIPRKNGKSVLGAIIGNYMFVADGEEGSEVYSGATTEKQAWEVFRPAKLMTEKNPPYKSHFKIQVNAKNLYHPESASRFEPVVGNPGDGASPHCSIVDEYHEHKTSDLYDTMDTGMGAREQPLQAVITTAGTNLAGPCYNKRNQIIKILEGVFDNDRIFGIIYTVDKEDDWTDIKTWKKANPNYGVSVNEEYLETQLNNATQEVGRQNILRCKHLNQWLNANVAWMDMQKWATCSNETLKPEDFINYPCFLGLDLASTTDIACLAQVFKDTVGKENNYYAFVRHYLPEETVYKKENDHYRGWEKEGLLTVTPGAVTDYSYIEDDIKSLVKQYNVIEVPYDPAQASYLRTRLEAHRIEMVEVGATMVNFSEPMKELEKAVLSGRFFFDGDPILTWMASNVVAHLNKKDYIYPNKENVQNKIDGIVAIIMTIRRAIDRVDVVNPYSKRGLPVL